MLELEKAGCSSSEFEEKTAGALKKAVDGNMEEGSFMCGLIAGMVKKEQSAAEIIADIIRETKGLLGK
jgi:enoyl-[acyl-carrier protein] reductase II